jgi:plastocyanin
VSHASGARGAARAHIATLFPPRRSLQGFPSYSTGKIATTMAPEKGTTHRQIQSERRYAMKMFHPLYSLGRRRRLATRLVPIALLVIAALAVVGCGGSTTTTTAAPVQTTAGDGSATTVGGGTDTTAGTDTTVGSDATNAVLIASFAFSPSSLTVKVGDTVTWTNNDSASHTVVADDGSFKSADLGQGASYQFTFKTAGTYTYKCSIHPSMTGTIVVQ